MTLARRCSSPTRCAARSPPAAPVVALESSLIAQGLPAPHNLETALAAEAAVRESGAVPATTALEDGRLVLGADRDAPRTPGRSGAATSRRRRRATSGRCSPRGALASTTVSATMRHRASWPASPSSRPAASAASTAARRRSFDVSSDIDELAATPVAVVSSGAKSILDLPATLELLETRRVPVVGYGVDELPAFYSVELRAARSRHRVDGPERGRRRDPRPPGRARAPAASSSSSRRRRSWRSTPPRWRPGSPTACADAEARGVRGGAVTPHLLGYLARASGGRTLAREHRPHRQQRAHGGRHRIGLDLTGPGAMLGRPVGKPAEDARAMRIYDGSPRQDWEEVLRSIGAFADREQLKEMLFLELEGGFLLQGLGLQAAGGRLGQLRRHSPSAPTS